LVLSEEQSARLFSPLYKKGYRNIAPAIYQSHTFVFSSADMAMPKPGDAATAAIKL
jgi:hypothetical protein